jgi:hypothetical protein
LLIPLEQADLPLDIGIVANQVVLGLKMLEQEMKPDNVMQV